jgi:hypothetical protein
MIKGDFVRINAAGEASKFGKVIEVHDDVVLLKVAYKDQRDTELLGNPNYRLLGISLVKPVTTLKDIRKALKTMGEVKFGNLEITLDSLNNCEVSKDGKFLFSATSWWDLEDYLMEEGIGHSTRKGLDEHGRIKLQSN